MSASFDYIIVGAGLFGSTLAERIASNSDYSVLVLEKRPHIGGNCHSQVDPETGIEFHTYGAHIFHTSYAPVWSYIRQFSEFSSYCHRVLAMHSGELYPLPVNLTLINRFFGKHMTPSEAEAFIASLAEDVPAIETFEDVALASVGRELYEAFFRGYTLKQWGRDPRDIPAATAKRLPLRFSHDDAYYDDIWCGQPLGGYSAIFERMLDRPGITVLTDTDYFDVRDEFQARRKLVYTGPIDRFFDFAEGRLSYRSVDLVAETHDVRDFQGAAVINYPDPQIPYTRIIEPRHFHSERTYGDRTLVQREFPREDDGSNPMYPVNSPSDRDVLVRYGELALQTPDVVFGGRLGTYRYLDMDDAVLGALETYAELLRAG